MKVDNSIWLLYQCQSVEEQDKERLIFLSQKCKQFHVLEKSVGRKVDLDKVCAEEQNKAIFERCFFNIVSGYPPGNRKGVEISEHFDLQ